MTAGWENLGQFKESMGKTKRNQGKPKDCPSNFAYLSSSASNQKTGQQHGQKGLSKLPSLFVWLSLCLIVFTVLFFLGGLWLLLVVVV